MSRTPGSGPRLSRNEAMANVGNHSSPIRFTGGSSQISKAISAWVNKIFSLGNDRPCAPGRDRRPRSLGQVPTSERERRVKALSKQRYSARCANRLAIEQAIAAARWFSLIFHVNAIENENTLCNIVNDKPELLWPRQITRFLLELN